MSNSPASPCPSRGQDSGSDSKVAGDQAETTVSGKINQLSTVVRLPYIWKVFNSRKIRVFR